MKKYAAVDIGGTAIKYGIIDEGGKILFRKQQATEAAKGGPAVLKKVENIIEDLSSNEKPDGICISTAGIVDSRKGEVRYSASLIPGYTGTKYKEEFEKRFGIPCEVENDVNCAGLAEAISGAARESKISLMLTIGTGIGGSLIIDGEIYQGAFGSACELGYMHMDGSDFQTLGSARTLTKKVAEWKGEPESEWNGYHIFEEAKKGDKLCNKAIDEMTEVLGKGIANICYILNPDMVVLGGGIMAQKDFLQDKIRKSVDKYLIPCIALDTEIVFAQHKNDAGMLGAFYHFRRLH